MSITLSNQELAEITGYERPADQLVELHRQGFYRARRSSTSGKIILERDHYIAVCAGAKPANAPKVRVPQTRMAA